MEVSDGSDAGRTFVFEIRYEETETIAPLLLQLAVATRIQAERAPTRCAPICKADQTQACHDRWPRIDRQSMQRQHPSVKIKDLRVSKVKNAQSLKDGRCVSCTVSSSNPPRSRESNRPELWKPFRK